MTRPRGYDRRPAFGRATNLVSVTASILALLSFATPASGQLLAEYDYEDLEFRGIGVEVGRVWPANVEPTNMFGIILDLGLIGPRVRVLPSARFWGSSLKASEVDRLADQIILVCERQVDANCPAVLDLGEVKLSDLELATEARFLPVGERTVAPYVGLGLALHLLNGRGDFIDDTFVEDLLDSVAPGISTVTGFSVRLGSSVMIGVEGRFMIASDVRYSAASLGGVWTLPTPRASAAP